MPGSTDTPSRSRRWAPWWAIVLTVLSLVLPVMILSVGIDQLFYASTGGYMSDLAQLVGLVATIAGVLLLAPGVAYLILRRQLLFFAAMVLGGPLALLALLAVLGII